MHPYQEMNHKLMAMFDKAAEKYRIPANPEVARKIKKIEKRQAELEKVKMNLVREG